MRPKTHTPLLQRFLTEAHKACEKAFVSVKRAFDRALDESAADRSRKNAFAESLTATKTENQALENQKQAESDANHASNTYKSSPNNKTKDANFRAKRNLMHANNALDLRTQNAAKARQALTSKEKIFKDKQRARLSADASAGAARSQAIAAAATYLEYKHADDFVAEELIEISKNQEPSLINKLLQSWSLKGLVAMIQFIIAGSNVRKLNDFISMGIKQKDLTHNLFLDALLFGIFGSIQLGLLPLILIYFVISPLTDLVDDSVYYMNQVALSVMVSLAILVELFAYWILFNSQPPWILLALAFFVLILIAFTVMSYENKGRFWSRLTHVIIISVLPLALLVSYETLHQQIVPFLIAAAVEVAVVIFTPPLMDKYFDSRSDVSKGLKDKWGKLTFLLLVSAAIGAIFFVKDKQPEVKSVLPSQNQATSTKTPHGSKALK